MKLTLVVENTEELYGGASSTHVFREDGGVVGSDAICDWVLKDSKHTIDGQHLRIFESDDSFCAEAIGEADIYVNASTRPIDSNAPFQIKDGDHLQIGKFNLSAFVSMSVEDKEGIEGREKWAHRFMSVENLVPGALSKKIEDNRMEAEALLNGEIDVGDVKVNLGKKQNKSRNGTEDPIDLIDKTNAVDGSDSFDPLEILDKERDIDLMSDNEDLAETLGKRYDSHTRGTAVDDPVPDGNHIAMPRFGKSNSDISLSSDDEVEDYISQLENSMKEIDFTVSENAKSDIELNESWLGQSTGQEALEDDEMVDHVVLRPLLAAMGINATDMSVPQANALTRDVGRAIRATVENLINISSKQQRDRNLMNETQLHLVEDNPIRLSNDTDDVIHDLFMNKSPVHLSAEAAITESLCHILNHEVASKAATDAALKAVLDSLSPVQLAKRFQKYKGHAPRSGNLDAWHWQMYQHYYQELSSDRQRGLGRMFNEVFKQVYDREMRAQEIQKV
jgi:type VI secretion system protein ImpI